MRKGIFERAYLNWHYRKDILMKDISERAFPKGHFDEGHFEGRAFPKGERAKGMKGIVHKLEFPRILQPATKSGPTVSASHPATSIYQRHQHKYILN